MATNPPTGSIYGLRQILDLFARTEPLHDNIEEWNRIRDTIIRYSDMDEEYQFKHFVAVLGATKPLRDNIGEWDEIRKTCFELLTEWDITDKQARFDKLLLRFVATRPSIANVEEWRRIKELSDRILRREND